MKKARKGEIEAAAPCCFFFLLFSFFDFDFEEHRRLLSLLFSSRHYSTFTPRYDRILLLLLRLFFFLGKRKERGCSFLAHFPVVVFFLLVPQILVAAVVGFNPPQTTGSSRDTRQAGVDSPECGIDVCQARPADES